MTNFKTLAILAALTLVCLASAQAIPDNVCCGTVYYGGNPVTTYSVTSYNSPVDHTTNYTPLYQWIPTFYFGSHDWAAGTYYICVMDASGHWYHTNFYHTLGQGTSLGTINLNSGAHPVHRYTDD